MFCHCLDLRRGNAPGGFTGSIRIRVDRFAMDILDILRTDVCLQRAPSCIHIVFYQGLGLRRSDALGGFTGSILIKSDSFAKDILHFLDRVHHTSCFVPRTRAHHSESLSLLHFQMEQIGRVGSAAALLLPFMSQTNEEPPNVLCNSNLFDQKSIDSQATTLWGICE